GLTATRERNGVLFFVAVKERKFAVLGDTGIDQKVPHGFWDNVVAAVGERFRKGQFGEGLVEGIRMAGEQLAAHFPPRAAAVDQLPDRLSRSRCGPAPPRGWRSWPWCCPWRPGRSPPRRRRRASSTTAPASSPPRSGRASSPS